MGVISDLHFEAAAVQYQSAKDRINDLLDKTDNEKLVRKSRKSKDSLVVGIIEFYDKKNRLSEKQRYCLGRWLDANR